MFYNIFYIFFSYRWRLSLWAYLSWAATAALPARRSSRGSCIRWKNWTFQTECSSSTLALIFSSETWRSISCTNFKVKGITKKNTKIFKKLEKKNLFLYLLVLFHLAMCKSVTAPCSWPPGCCGQSTGSSYRPPSSSAGLFLEAFDAFDTLDASKWHFWKSVLF